MGTMQPVTDLFGDALSAVTVYLGTKIGAAAFVGMDLSKWDRKLPSVQVGRIGGRADGVYDVLVLQLDVRSDDWDECLDIMALVRKYIAEAPLELDYVKRTREARGPRTIPEVGEPNARITCDFSVTVTAAV